MWRQPPAWAGLLLRRRAAGRLGGKRKGPERETAPGPCLVTGVVGFDLFWTRAKILDKAKGPERETAPGPCLVARVKGLEPLTY